MAPLRRIKPGDWDKCFEGEFCFHTEWALMDAVHEVEEEEQSSEGEDGDDVRGGFRYVHGEALPRLQLARDEGNENGEEDHVDEGGPEQQPRRRPLRGIPHAMQLYISDSDDEDVVVGHVMPLLEYESSDNDNGNEVLEPVAGPSGVGQPQTQGPSSSVASGRDGNSGGADQQGSPEIPRILVDEMDQRRSERRLGGNNGASTSSTVLTFRRQRGREEHGNIIYQQVQEEDEGGGGDWAQLQVQQNGNGQQALLPLPMELELTPANDDDVDDSEEADESDDDSSGDDSSDEGDDSAGDLCSTFKSLCQPSDTSTLMMRMTMTMTVVMMIIMTTSINELPSMILAVLCLFLIFSLRDTPIDIEDVVD